jgi:hypothetical protein
MVDRSLSHVEQQARYRESPPITKSERVWAISVKAVLNKMQPVNNERLHIRPNEPKALEPELFSCSFVPVHIEILRTVPAAVL